MNRSRYSLYVVILSSLAATILSVIINIILIDQAFNESDRQRAETDRKNCSTLAALLAAYAETPPSTLTGKNVARAYQEQYDAFSCRSVLSPK